jgi:hypothetical protein
MREKILLKVALNTITLALTQRIIWGNEKNNCTRIIFGYCLIVYKVFIFGVDGPYGKTIF